MKGGGLGPSRRGSGATTPRWRSASPRLPRPAPTSPASEALDAVAEGLPALGRRPAADIGIQTRGAARDPAAAGRRRGRPGTVMREEAAAYAARHPHSAGNGALMRTAPVALAHLDDRDHLAQAARLVAELTHADPLAGDSCVLWCEAIRVAVLEGRIDVRTRARPAPRGAPRPVADVAGRGRQPARRAGSRPTGSPSPHSRPLSPRSSRRSDDVRRFPCDHLQDALHAAIRIGDDTDTVAAIAGGLLGARWGASAVPVALATGGARLARSRRSRPGRRSRR